MRGRIYLLTVMAAMLPCTPLSAQAFDAAVAFGSRPSIEQISLSPDGKRIAFVVPDAKGQGSSVFVSDVGAGASPKPILHTAGKPTRLQNCTWLSDTRLLCSTYGVGRAAWDVAGAIQRFAVDVDGTDMKEIGRNYRRFGSIVDWLADDQDAVLIRFGRGVVRLDTRTMRDRPAEAGRDFACSFRSDGRGTVRVMGICRYDGAGLQQSAMTYLFRPKRGGDWRYLGDYDTQSEAGFYPVAVDADRDVAYGFMRLKGRRAAYEMMLDGSGKTKLLFASDTVDVDGFITIGRQKRVVGVRYVTDVPHSMYFDPALEKLRVSLSKTLPHQPTITIVDASRDETKLLILADGDDDPGTYYLLDRTPRRMTQLLRVRPELDGHPLAKMTTIEYVAADGTKIPAYLTLPAGGSGRGLPAIVLPHGGPAARDEWGFDWLSQYFADRGFAVLQPQFRGSSGYGDVWFQNNGFKSWRSAIGDVLDAGRWMISQGIADPNRIAAVGWSYGGYAALQSSVVDPYLFKAIIAVAPVTDLGRLKAEAMGWSNAKLVNDFVGDGPHLREGSPAQNATRIKAPVLIFHAENDANVSISESRLMADRLAVAGVPHELVTWPELDHQLEDSAVRAELLRKSEAFLRTSMGM